MAEGKTGVDFVAEFAEYEQRVLAIVACLLIISLFECEQA
jgi:hypothetical protein